MITIKGDSVPPVLIMWTPEVDLLVGIVDETLHMFGLHAVVTSGMEGTHSRKSKHYRGYAVDFRVNWTKTQEKAFLTALSKKLEGSGRAILETDHLHVETI
jgi:hypothetical protein